MAEPTANAVSYAQINTEPPSLDEIVPGVPRYLARTIRRMLAKDPQDRFETMAEVGDLLRAHLERYLLEANGAAPPSRELWRAVPQDASVAALSHAPTEIHELSVLAPPTAPPVTLPTPQAQDTSPVSRPPFSEPRPNARPRPNVQVTEPIRIVPPTAPTPSVPSAPRSAASGIEHRGADNGAVRTRSGSTAFPNPVRPPSNAPGGPPRAPHEPPGGRARLSTATSNPPRSNELARPAQASTRSRAVQHEPNESWSWLTIGIPLGAVAGLLVGLAAYWHPHPATSSAEEPVVLVSAQPPLPAEVPPPSRDPAAAPAVSAVLATQATPPPRTTTTEAPPRPAMPAPALAAAPKTSAASISAPLPVAHAAVKPAQKPPAPTAHGGLWDMSDLDTPTQPKPAAPAASQRQSKAIYGGDTVAR